MSEYKDKLYVIGSLSQSKAIMDWANYYISTGRYRVRYVKREDGKSFESLVRKCFLNILWADRILIICKPDGSCGQGCTYEKVFAKLIGKRVDERIEELDPCDSQPLR